MKEAKARQVALGLLLALSVTACGSTQSQALGPAAGPTGSPSIRVADTPEWQQEGARLRQFKKAQNAQGGSPVGCFGAAMPCNAGDFAYQSLPIDISGPGLYRFQFGPLGTGFDFPTSPRGVSWIFPGDATFVILPAGTDPTVMTIGGQRFLEMTFSVTEFRGSYPRFSGWIT